MRLLIVLTALAALISSAALAEPGAPRGTGDLGLVIERAAGAVRMRGSA